MGEEQSSRRRRKAGGGRAPSRETSVGPLGPGLDVRSYCFDCSACAGPGGFGEACKPSRIGASGRCARKPWTNAASSRVPALELGLAGWLPRLLGTVLCELPLGECGACACYEALRQLTNRASSGTRGRSVGRRRCICLARVSESLTRRRGARPLAFEAIRDHSVFGCAAGPEPYFISDREGISFGLDFIKKSGFILRFVTKRRRARSFRAAHPRVCTIASFLP